MPLSQPLPIKPLRSRPQDQTGSFRKPSLRPFYNLFPINPLAPVRTPYTFNVNFTLSQVIRLLTITN